MVLTCSTMWSVDFNLDNSFSLLVRTSNSNSSLSGWEFVYFHFLCCFNDFTFSSSVSTKWKSRLDPREMQSVTLSSLFWATLICTDLFLVSNVYVFVSLSRNPELISSAIKAKGSRQAPIATSSTTSLFRRRNWNWEVENRSERRKISSVWVLTDRYLCARACVDVLLLQYIDDVSKSLSWENWNGLLNRVR